MNPRPPLLSIVVPTRDRIETALPCIRALSRIAGDDLEIIVSDCGAHVQLAQGIAEIGDPRIRYAAQSPCSMTENWNLAYALCRGDYVTFIGDDDAFLPRGAPIIRKLAAENVDAVAYPYRAGYFWNNFPDAGRAGKLILVGVPAQAEPHDRHSAQTVSARAGMLSALRGLAAPPLPVVYHGVVARRVLELVVNRAGTLFETRAPDTFASAALCSVLDRYVVLDQPLSMVGKSGRSNSAYVVDGSEQRQHRLQFAEDKRAWHPATPPVEGVEAYVAESYGSAFRSMADHEYQTLYLRRFLGSAYADGILRNPGKALSIAAHYWRKARPAEPGIINAGFLTGLVSRMAERMGARLSEKIGAGGAGDREMLDVPSFEAAIALIESRLG